MKFLKRILFPDNSNYRLATAKLAQIKSKLLFQTFYYNRGNIDIDNYKPVYVLSKEEPAI